MQESELQNDMQLDETIEVGPESEFVDPDSEFLDIAIYLYDAHDLTGAYVGFFGACLIAYMLFTVILRTVGGDN